METSQNLCFTHAASTYIKEVMKKAALLIFLTVSLSHQSDKNIATNQLEVHKLNIMKVNNIKTSNAAKD